MAGGKGVGVAVVRAAAVVAVCMLADSALQSQPRDSGWLLVHSDGVAVLTDADEVSARQIHDQVREARDVLADATGHVLGDAIEPIRVLAPRGADGMRAIVGDAARRNGGLLMAAALPSPFGRHLAVRADSSRARSAGVLQHELMHLIVADLAGEVPAWLDEGLAEFWSTAERRPDGVMVGATLGSHLRVLEYANRWIPWTQLQSVPRGRYDLAGAPVGVFYAQSWLAVHFLLTAPGAADNVLPSQEAVAALSDATLRGYAAAPRAQVRLRSKLSSPVTGAATVEPLTPLEADARRAAVLVFGERQAEAERLVRAVLERQPSHVLGLRTMGLVAFLGNRPEEAREWLRRSLAEDDSDYLSHYYYAVLMAENQTVAVRHLERSLELRPGLAEAERRLKEIRVVAR
jgi:hypothetical protein